MIGSFSACSARAANGHVTAVPPIAVMSSRRVVYPEPGKE